MKRLSCAVLAVTLGIAGTGCIAVSANRFASDLDAVVSNGHIYVVNKRTGKIAQVDAGRLTTIRDLIDDDDCE